MTISVVIADDQALVRAGFRVLVNTAPDLRVVGEPAQLFARAGQLLTQLKARGYATLDQLGDIHITAVVRERPAVYSSFGGKANAPVTLALCNGQVAFSPDIDGTGAQGDIAHGCDFGNGRGSAGQGVPNSGSLQLDAAGNCCTANWPSCSDS